MITTNPVRLFALLATVASVVVSAALINRAGGDVISELRSLRYFGETEYAVCLGWLVLAPLPMVVGSAYVPISPTPWVLVALAQLSALVALSLHQVDTLPPLYWCGAVACGAAAVASVVAAAAGAGPRRGDF